MSKNAKIVLVLLLLCVVIAVVPMIFLGGTAEFGGADGEAEAAITEIDQDYEPWYASPMEHIFPDGHIGNQRQFLMDDDDSLLLTVLDFRKLAYFAVINNIALISAVRINAA